jgi:hypothetical protein
MSALSTQVATAIQVGPAPSPIPEASTKPGTTRHVCLRCGRWGTATWTRCQCVVPQVVVCHQPPYRVRWAEGWEPWRRTDFFSMSAPRTLALDELSLPFAEELEEEEE